MHYLWKIKKGFLKDIVDQFPKPKPAYTTVSTVVRVLVKKGFISFQTYGKIHEYSTTISKKQYLKERVKPIISDYFNGSPTQLVSYFAEGEMDLHELENIQQLIEEKIKQLKTKNK